jgi:hypothetical protein
LCAQSACTLENANERHKSNRTTYERAHQISRKNGRGDTPGASERCHTGALHKVIGAAVVFSCVLVGYQGRGRKFTSSISGIVNKRFVDKRIVDKRFR